MFQLLCYNFPLVNIPGKDQKELKGIQKNLVMEEFYHTVLTMAVFRQRFKISTENCISIKTVHVKFGNPFRQYRYNNAGQKVKQFY